MHPNEPTIPTGRAKNWDPPRSSRREIRSRARACAIRLHFLYSAQILGFFDLVVPVFQNPKSLSSLSSLERTNMSRSGQPPDLKKYMDKKLQIKLNANRVVIGTLRGFDQFMNLVVDNTVEVNGNDKNDIGMVVIRGNSVVMIEALEPVGRTA
ncbi:hypothetical protein LUZ63_005263 [Rhynchospora breviuscula]|uniref:Small nuclear ribonucleoprotein G n=2 Tax=Rhynchospora TaxID=46332 RepID=A0A9Q0CMQ7_9POAL|nr:hypothetical protein LUZ63_005263 [Rhynchospora breviuscula]